MIVLGLDPGFASCGYAEMSLDSDGHTIDVSRMGVIRTKKASKKRNLLQADDATRRTKELSALIGMMVRDCDIVCSEALSEGFSNAITSKLMGMVWGVMTAHVQINGRPLLTVSPAALRSRLLLPPKASKDDLRDAMWGRFGQAKLQKLLLGTPKGQRQHAYDALAAAVTSLQDEQVLLLLATRRQLGPTMHSA